MATRQGEMEDVVEYCLYPSLPDNLDKRELKKFLEEQLDLYLAHFGDLLVEQIWQKEAFRLSVVTSAAKGPGHLYGRTCFGDSVDDEWFIVYLLRQLTLAFPGLIAKVWDNDGEFLLIEAANSLPKWVNPNTAENRVYIYGGKVHLIPVAQGDADTGCLPAGTPSIQDAVSCLRSQPACSTAAEHVQRDIQARIAQFPEKMQSSIQHAHCYLPANLAAVLEYNPALISPIVDAFYTRDPLDLKSCITMQYFRPGTRVTRRIKFTRCLYAQLMQQRFQPDKRSGFNIPPPNSPHFKAYDLGMKLAHGAEILCSKSGGSPSSGNTHKRYSQYDMRWQHYLAALKEKGYFRGELEGSHLYDKLLDEAKKYYFDTILTDKSCTSEPGERVLHTLKLVSYDIEDMRRQEKSLLPEDDDSWLKLSPQQLDAILTKASAGHMFDMSTISDTITSFVDHVSSHEGATFPKGEDGEVTFDPNSFMQTMQQMFEFEDDSGGSSTDMSEYGSEDDELDSQQRTAAGGVDLDVGDYLGLGTYMKMMDKELATTEVGKSFQRLPKGSDRVGKAPLSSGIDDDLEDIDDLDDDFQPVDVDMNLVKNMLESYKTQDGLAGPAGNILHSMGVQPQDRDVDEELL